MTDGNTGRETYPGEPAADGTGRLTKVLGGGVAVALLATIGATGGWLLAGEDAGPPDANAGSTTSTTSTTPTTPTAPVTPANSPATNRTTAPAQRTTVPAPPTGLTVPLVVGADFEDARDELRDRRLGWRLVFGAGTGRTVRSSTPPPGMAVSRGTTVVLYVAGPAPALDVPDLLGDDCAEAVEELVEEGLYPRYSSGKKGIVTAQDPGPDSTAHWNDTVALTCGEKQSEPNGQA